ncbi:MAG: ABC transporter permease [Gammaproteobacteria bacterium]
MNNSITNSLLTPATQLIKYRELIWQLTKRDVIARYRGSMAGLLWSFFNPIFMLLIYTFFFSVIYKARFGQAGGESKISFAITLFAGLIPFSLFSECINRAPQLIINNVNYVKKVIFPLEILSWTNLGAALFHALISVSVLLIFFFWQNHYIPWTVILFPLVNLPLLFLILGLSWFLASLGVFIRDIGHSITIFTLSLMFLSPVFYSIDSIPEPYRNFIYFNPLTAIIEQNRAVLIWGHLPDWSSLGVSLLVGMTIAWLGYFWFEKTRHAFADVV